MKTLVIALLALTASMGEAVEQADTKLSAALSNSLIIKDNPGRLVSVTITNTNAAEQWILVINATSIPANGPVTLLCAPIRVAGTSTTMKALPIPLWASVGIVICNSTTAFSGTTPTKTIGAADCFFEAQVQ